MIARICVFSTVGGVLGHEGPEHNRRVFGVGSAVVVFELWRGWLEVNESRLTDRRRGLPLEEVNENEDEVAERDAEHDEGDESSEGGFLGFISSRDLEEEGPTENVEFFHRIKN